MPLALSVALVVAGTFLVAAPAVAMGVNTSIQRFDCGFDGATTTLRPEVDVRRDSLTGTSYSSPDSRVSVTMYLLENGVQRTSLAAGVKNEDGSVTSGATTLPTFTTKTFTPWAGSFGDGSYGGPALDPAAAYVVRVRVYDYDVGEQELTEWACPLAPPEADLVSTDHSTFKLDGGAWSAHGSRLSSLGLDAKTLAQAQTGTPAKGARENCTEGASAMTVALSFCWNNADSTDEDWYPQGIASSGESQWTGVAEGTLIVTWYSKTTPASARITVVNMGDPENIIYRHFRLKEAVTCGTGGVCLKDINTHAGGLAWRGRYLYVPQTKTGFRVFDLTRFLKSDGAFVLPQVAYHKKRSTAPSDLVFSYSSAAGTSLLSGEYHSGSPGARVIHWPLNLTGKLKVVDGSVAATQALVTEGELTNLQGVDLTGSRHLFCRSRGVDDPGTLYGLRANLDPATGMDYVVGCEDLTIHGSLVWSLGEHPGKRAVVGVHVGATPGA